MLNYAYKPMAIEETAKPTPAPVVSLAAFRNPAPSWNILLVEDDPSDVTLTKMALRSAEIPHHLHNAANGKEVLGCLNGQCAPEFNRTPDVVLLDLSLPDKNGFEILAEISALPNRYRSLPFVILTGSEHYRYITHTYDLWMPAYLTKPCTAEKMKEAFSAVNAPRKRNFSPVPGPSPA